MALLEKLNHIQTELKAPKNLINKFGGYSYRNAEGILEALKPLLKKYECIVCLSDEVVEIGGRVYVKATATISDNDSMLKTVCSYSATAYAREADSKKGMDDAQLTGATGSYARKYALNGLFLLDDNKDADTDEYHEQTTKTAKKAPAKKEEPKAPVSFICEVCGEPIAAHGENSAATIAEHSTKRFGKQMCYECAMKEKAAQEVKEKYSEVGDT